MDPNSYFLTFGDPQTPPAKFLHHYILLLITFDLICNMTMFEQNGFWTLQGHPRHFNPLPPPPPPSTIPLPPAPHPNPAGPASRGYIKIPNEFL